MRLVQDVMFMNYYNLQKCDILKMIKMCTHIFKGVTIYICYPFLMVTPHGIFKIHLKIKNVA